MASCYHCGKSGANYRRNIMTGYSTGSWVSKRSYGTSSRNYYGLRTVCENCAARIDKRNAIKTTVVLVLVAICLLYYISVR